MHAAGDGAYIVIPDLIAGDTYIASAQVQGGPGLEDVLMAISGASTSSAQVGVPYGGNAILDIGYGQGPYGGVEAGTADMPTGQWFNPSMVFTAQESTVMLSFQSLAGSDVAYPRSSGWMPCWSRPGRTWGRTSTAARAPTTRGRPAAHPGSPGPTSTSARKYQRAR